MRNKRKEDRRKGVSHHNVKEQITPPESGQEDRPGDHGDGQESDDYHPPGALLPRKPRPRCSLEFAHSFPLEDASALL